MLAEFPRKPSRAEQWKRNCWRTGFGFHFSKIEYLPIDFGKRDLLKFQTSVSKVIKKLCKRIKMGVWWCHWAPQPKTSDRKPKTLKAELHYHQDYVEILQWSWCVAARAEPAVGIGHRWLSTVGWCMLEGVQLQKKKKKKRTSYCCNRIDPSFLSAPTIHQLLSIRDWCTR